MSKSKELLPLGSIVYLEEGTQKLVIVGRGVIFDDPDTGKQVFTDLYGRSLSPRLTNRFNNFFSSMKI